MVSCLGQVPEIQGADAETERSLFQMVHDDPEGYAGQ